MKKNKKYQQEVKYIQRPGGGPKVAKLIKMKHHNPEPLDSFLKTLIRRNNLGAGINTRQVFQAWDKISGAEQYTIKKFFRSGVLYITLNSSMARSYLQFQKDWLIDKINAYLSQADLFDDKNKIVGYVREIVLK